MLSEEEKKAIEKLSNGEKIELISLIRVFKREGIENFVITRKKYVDTVLNLITKQQKEIEENKFIISMANNDMLGYNQGYLDGKNQNSNATEIIVKTRQFDMYNEQIRLYKRKIDELKKENNMLKNHIHYKKCQNCGKEYRSKRNDSKYCSECAKTVNNKNYYKNLTEEQKNKRREKAKINMRKLRERRKLR